MSYKSETIYKSDRFKIVREPARDGSSQLVVYEKEWKRVDVLSSKPQFPAERVLLDVIGVLEEEPF